VQQPADEADDRQMATRRMVGPIFVLHDCAHVLGA
jgi:hypothetical protein